MTACRRCSQSTRTGSVLILAIGLVLVMVVMATTFMSLMSQQRGIGTTAAIRQRVDLYTDEVVDRSIASLVDELTTADGFTCFRNEWYYDNITVDNDGNPVWHHQFPQASQDIEVNSESAREAWSLWYGGRTPEDGQAKTTWNIPIEQFQISQYHWKSAGPVGINRWHYDHFLDDDLNEIDTGDVIEDRDRARYALRSIRTSFDHNGLLSLDPGWPEPVPVVDSSDPRWMDFLAYQNYVNHFARNLKSMVGQMGRHRQHDAIQYRPEIPRLDPIWPYDLETVGYTNSGDLRSAQGSVGSNVRPPFGWRDQRIAFENIFRRTGLQQLTTPGRVYPMLSTGVYTFEQLREVLEDVGSDAHAHFDGWRVWQGFAPGMRAAPLDGTDDCSVPWRVNALTAPSMALDVVVFGLSDRIKRAANAPIFGRGFPEAFPLRSDAGRYNALRSRQYEWSSEYIQDQCKLALFHDTSYDNYAPVSDSDAYELMFDIGRAIDIAIGVARRVYHDEITPVSDSHFEPYSPSYNSDLDRPTASEVQRALLLETLRVLGALGSRGDANYGIQANGGVYSTPAGIFTGRPVPTGYGGEIRKTGSTSSTINLAYRNSVLPPDVDSRACEYILNDMLLSLFGTANPDVPNCAVDFNNDGMAESTLTGWWDGEQTVWSWWWNGLGPREALDPDHDNPAVDDDVPDWLQQATWLRFDARVPGGILRWNGSQWQVLQNLPRADIFYAVNEAFFNDRPWSTGNQLPGHNGGTLPIRPFSHTGRIFVGLSDTFGIWTRSECYDLRERTTLFRRNKYTIYHRDPNHDGDPRDGYISQQTAFDVKNYLVFAQ